MRAFLNYKYGTPDDLQLKDIPIPQPKAGEVRIKIHAVSINASDWELLTGTPIYSRVFGLWKPRKNILGSDIAGTVGAVGKHVSRFKTGDEVYADILGQWGGFAEYVCVPEKELWYKPASLTFEQASAIPQAGVIALQGLREKGLIQHGEKVLINGAGGGGGSFAIQMAKMYGAEVTAVDNAEKQQFMLSLGADHVVDYRKENYTQNGQKYNRIVDYVAWHSLSDYKKSLQPGGKFFQVGGSTSLIFKLLLAGPFIALFSGKKLAMLPAKLNQGLDEIASLVESGKIKVAIDRIFSFDEIPDALRYLGEGHVKGKIVIKYS